SNDALTAWLCDDRAREFDFGSGVPLRITLMRRREGLRTIVLTTHHVLVDGGSLRNVWQDWFTVYEGLAVSPEVLLPGTPPFSDHVDWLERQDLAAAREFWQQRLAGLSQTNGFIVDRLYREATSPQRFAKCPVSLPGDLAR